MVGAWTGRPTVLPLPVSLAGLSVSLRTSSSQAPAAYGSSQKPVGIGLQAMPLWVTRKQAAQAQGCPLDRWHLEGGPHVPVSAERLPGLSFPTGASARGSRTPGLHEGGLHPGCHEGRTLPLSSLHRLSELSFLLLKT